MKRKNDLPTFIGITLLLFGSIILGSVKSFPISPSPVVPPPKKSLKNIIKLQFLIPK